MFCLKSPLFIRSPLFSQTCQCSGVYRLLVIVLLHVHHIVDAVILIVASLRNVVFSLYGTISSGAPITAVQQCS